MPQVLLLRRARAGLDTRSLLNSGEVNYQFNETFAARGRTQLRNNLTCNVILFSLGCICMGLLKKRVFRRRDGGVWRPLLSDATQHTPGLLILTRGRPSVFIRANHHFHISTS